MTTNHVTERTPRRRGAHGADHVTARNAHAAGHVTEDHAVSVTGTGTGAGMKAAAPGSLRHVITNHVTKRTTRRRGAPGAGHVTGKGAGVRAARETGRGTGRGKEIEIETGGEAEGVQVYKAEFVLVQMCRNASVGKRAMCVSVSSV